MLYDKLLEGEKKATLIIAISMKDENGETYNGSFDDQMKSLLEDIIGESDHPISTTTEGDN